MKEVHFYNTNTRKKEKFVPLREGRVGMYVCGITSYDLCHVGHARAYITFDVIRRAFEHFGYDVLHIQNFTDIDDKIIERANERGASPDEFSEKYIDAFFRDMDALNVKRASLYPKVTKHIPEIIEAVQSLVDKGAAYTGGGSVYFNVASAKNYGALSGRGTSEEELKSRIDDPNKKSVLDFALWKESKPGEPFWESPWGKGRPGWHLECNVMSSLYLGAPFDIHGGGHDLIFPHHENESAIASGLSEDGFARYWIHNGFVNIEEEKMSKSLGNITAVRDVLDKFPADVIRLFLLSTHYRMPLNFSTKTLEETAAGYARFASLRERLENIAPGFVMSEHSDKNLPDGPASELASAINKSAEKFDDAMADDFNTPGAVAEIYNLVKAGNNFTATVEAGNIATDTTAICASLIWSSIIKYGNVLGLTFESAAGASSSAGSDDLDAAMQLLIDLRNDARKSKDFATADRIRDTLADAGITLKDHPDGTTWSCG
ncbi:cysteine--tRNA ligase, partial [bacterium]